MRPEAVRKVLRDMLREIDGVQATLGSQSLSAFTENWALRRSAERAIEIISEAGRRLPQEICDRAPEIAWRELRGIGNILRHEYDDVVDETIYKIVRERLPGLRAALIALDASLD